MSSNPRARKKLDSTSVAALMGVSGGFTAMVVGSAGWTVTAMVIWFISAVGALYAVRSAQDEKAKADHVSLKEYLAAHPKGAQGSQLADEIRELLPVEDEAGHAGEENTDEE